MAQSIPASEFNRLSVPHLDACRRIGPCHRRSIIDVAYGSILLKNSENERRLKIRLWSCRADRATRCHRQFATIAAHGKVSLSAEPLALSSRSPPAASRIVIAAKNRVFQQYRSFSTFRPRARPVRCTSRTGRTGQNQILRSRAITGLTSRSSAASMDRARAAPRNGLLAAVQTKPSAWRLRAVSRMLSEAGRVVQPSIFRAFSDETRRSFPRSNNRLRTTGSKKANTRTRKSGKTREGTFLAFFPSPCLRTPAISFNE
jgi:hypothetical protein